MSYRGYGGDSGGGYRDNYSRGRDSGYSRDNYGGGDNWNVARDSVPSMREQKMLAPHNFNNNPNFIPITDSKNKFKNLKNDPKDFEKNVSIVCEEINKDAESSQFVSHKKKKY